MNIALPSHLTDHDLMAAVPTLVAHEHGATAHLIAHLAEVDVRELHVPAGFSSLFVYCHEGLGFSEDAAYNRKTAAQVARRYPEIIDMLADGRLSLTAVRVLAPVLTDENHSEAFAAASRKSKREVEKIAAWLEPKSDVPSSVRKLPVFRRPVVAPLAADRYRVQFTIGEETEKKLRRVQELLKREIPDGDPAVIFDRALTLLLRSVEAKKHGLTPKPRRGRGARPGSRYTPAAVRREVAARDELRCAFVAPDGRRCTERAFIEYHHARTPYAHGGEATVENMAMHCRVHNVYEAVRIFGRYVARGADAAPGYADGLAIDARSAVPERQARP